MRKEFSMSKMDDTVKTVKGKYTGREYRRSGNLWEFEENKRRRLTSWPEVLDKEGTVIEVVLLEVGSMIDVKDLHLLPNLSIVRGTYNGFVYVKGSSGMWTNVPFEGREVAISDLGGTFLIEWMDRNA